MEKTMNERTSSTSTAVYTRRITHEEQSSYIEVPFDMPDQVEEVHVTYRVESFGEPKAVIDLGVRDTRRVRGWSGGARTEFRIGREKATPGYIPGELTPGKWAVLHNAYKVPQEGCEVTVTVEFRFLGGRWLKGDLHTHSVHSDGTFTLEENAAIMEELGCDFIAMTDHNAVSQNLAYPRNTKVVMIPGMEFTTNFGHSNFLGVTDPLDDFRVSGQQDVNERLQTARERGAKIVLNHPHCDFCPWEWDFAVDHDWVEVWNGPWSARNERTLAWWQEQLAGGRRLVAIGGSDTHRPDPFVKHAMPCTWVYAECKTAQGILDGIGRGHVSISCAPEGPFLELSCGEGAYRTGDAVPAGKAGGGLKLAAEGLQPGDRIRWIHDSGLVKEVRCGEPGAGDWQEEGLRLDLDAQAEARFYRVEVWRHFTETGTELLAALTNPIYMER
ncbi:CehA/McbA family metallohydrolase [Paenibacillus sp. TAB 01]|uniref:CehA/McbA family metallohydrolase n=1 Tax=Paenibacillus sp. TAB 01 TaxID=3368988 RepID=UPI003750B7D5